MHRERALLLGALLLCPVSWPPLRGGRKHSCQRAYLCCGKSAWATVEGWRNKEAAQTQTASLLQAQYTWASAWVQLIFSWSKYRAPVFEEMKGRELPAKEEGLFLGFLISLQHASCLHIENAWCTDVSFTAAVLPPAKSTDAFSEARVSWRRYCYKYAAIACTRRSLSDAFLEGAIS